MTFVSHHKLLSGMASLILITSFAPGATSVVQKMADDAVGKPSQQFEQALEFTLKKEGGFVDHPSDVGGRTNFGVTQATYDAWRKSQGQSLQDVAKITKDEVRKIMFENFWKAGKCDRYDAPLSLVCFDSVINFGVDGGKSFFKEELPDDPMQAALEVVKRRIAYRYERVNENGSQKVFLEGWLNRDRALEKLVRGNGDAQN